MANTQRYMRAGDKERARSHLQSLIEKYPRSAEAVDARKPLRELE